MIDDDGLCPALGLRAFARIIDDDGLEMRQGAQGNFGIAR